MWLWRNAHCPYDCELQFVAVSNFKAFFLLICSYVCGYFYPMDFMPTCRAELTSVEALFRSLTTVVCLWIYQSDIKSYRLSASIPIRQMTWLYIPRLVCIYFMFRSSSCSLIGVKLTVRKLVILCPFWPYPPPMLPGNIRDNFVWLFIAFQVTILYFHWNASLRCALYRTNAFIYHVISRKIRRFSYQPQTLWGVYSLLLTMYTSEARRHKPFFTFYRLFSWQGRHSILPAYKKHSKLCYNMRFLSQIGKCKNTCSGILISGVKLACGDRRSATMAVLE